MSVSPLFMYQGSKTWMFNDTLPHIKAVLGRKSISTYVDLDAKGLHHYLRLAPVLREYGVNESILIFKRKEFADLFAAIQQTPNELIEAALGAFYVHSNLPEPNRASHYFAVRSEYNAAMVNGSIEKLGTLLFLQNHAQCGIVRINRYGSYTSPYSNGADSMRMTIETVRQQVMAVHRELNRGKVHIHFAEGTHMPQAINIAKGVSNVLYTLPPNCRYVSREWHEEDYQIDSLSHLTNSNFVMYDFAAPRLHQELKRCNCTVYMVTKNNVTSELRGSNFPSLIATGVHIDPYGEENADTEQ